MWIWEHFKRFPNIIHWIILHNIWKHLPFCFLHSKTFPNHFKICVTIQPKNYASKRHSKSYQIMPTTSELFGMIWNQFERWPNLGISFWANRIHQFRALAVSSRVAAGLPLKAEGREKCRRDKENILACRCRNGNPSETTCSMRESTSFAAIPRIPPTLPSPTISAAMAMPVGSVTDLSWCTKIARCTALDDAKESLKDLRLGTYTHLTSLMYVTEKSVIFCKNVKIKQDCYLYLYVFISLCPTLLHRTWTGKMRHTIPPVQTMIPCKDPRRPSGLCKASCEVSKLRC